MIQTKDENDEYIESVSLAHTTYYSIPDEVFQMTRLKKLF